MSPGARCALAMRALGLLALLVLAGCVAPVPGQDLGPTQEPGRAAFDTLGKAVRVTEGATATEMMVAIDPRDPDHIVMTTKVADRTRVPVATSFDGGATWKSSELPVGDFESDPVLAFAPDGGVLIVTLTTPAMSPVTGAALVGPDQLYPYTSRDGGLTWSRGERMTPDSWYNDHPWVATDFTRGRIHVATAGFPPEEEGPIGVYDIYSDDGGRTWSAPVLVCVGCTAPVNGVGGDGAVYIAANPAPDPPEGQQGTAVEFFRSDDGGATWSDSVVLDDASSRDGSRGTCGIRQSRWTAIPFVTGGPDSRVFVAYATHSNRLPVAPRPVGECPNIPDWDIVLRTSEDGGRTWSDSVVVNDDGGPLNAQAVPAVAVGPAGDVHVLWYDGRHDPTFTMMDVYYAHSKDGRSFDANIRVTPESMPDNGVVNDYLGVAATDARAFLAYAVTEGTDAAEVLVATVR